MNKDNVSGCVCGSGRPFSECCEPCLEGRKIPRTAKQLMRSRYAAYALGGHSDYLRKTWHPSKVAHISIADLDGSDYNWVALEILNSGQKGNVAQVEFKAAYLDGQGREHCHHEISTFLRQHGQWFYFDAVFPDMSAVNEQHRP